MVSQFITGRTPPLPPFMNPSGMEMGSNVMILASKRIGWSRPKISRKLIKDISKIACWSDWELSLGPKAAMSFTLSFWCLARGEASRFNRTCHKDHSLEWSAAALVAQCHGPIWPQIHHDPSDQRHSPMGPPALTCRLDSLTYQPQKSNGTDTISTCITWNILKIKWNGIWRKEID